MPTLPFKLPGALGAPAGSSLFSPSGFAYNFAVGGLPFLAAPDVDNPFVRQTAPFRKQQFDNSNEPGEQSLDGWWLRSQQSFHGGCGQRYLEIGVGDPGFSTVRYWQSLGVDPWTPGEIKLLKSMSSISGSVLTRMASDNVRAIGLTNGGLVWTYSSGGVAATEASPGGTVLDVATSGTDFYVATTTNIFKRTASAASGSAWTTIWNTTVTAAVLGWQKQRLVYASNAGVYELASGGPALPTAKWVPPGGAWTPTGFAEANGAIYACGYLSNTQQSFVLRFTLDNTGSLPTLTSGVVVAQLPTGDLIGQIFGYLGQFLAITSSAGPRVAIINGSGDLEVGPTLYAGNTTGNWLAFGDSIFTVGTGLPEFTGNTMGMVRVVLGTEISTDRFAYGSDVYTTSASGSASAVGVWQSRKLLATAGGVFLEDASTYLSSGWIQSSRIRFDTLEPKIYKLVRVRGDILSQPVQVQVIDDQDAVHDVVGFVSGQQPGAFDSAIPNLGPQQFVSIKLTLNGSGSSTARLSGYQLKALPGTPRRRQMQIPLWCFDFEEDRFGNVEGYPGRYFDRLSALENLDTKGDTVTLQDLDNGQTYVAVIDQVQYIQMAAPPPPLQGTGGRILLTVTAIS